MIIVFEEKDIMSGFTADDLAYLAASISPEAWTYYPGVIPIHVESESTQVLGYVPMAIIDELVQDCREDEIRQFIFNIIYDDKKIHEGEYAFRDHTIVITNSPQTIYTLEAFKVVSRRIFEENDDKEEFWRLLSDCIPEKTLASSLIWRSNGII